MDGIRSRSDLLSARSLDILTAGDGARPTGGAKISAVESPGAWSAADALESAPGQLDGRRLQSEALFFEQRFPTAQLERVGGFGGEPGGPSPVPPRPGGPLPQPPEFLSFSQLRAWESRQVPPWNPVSTTSPPADLDRRLGELSAFTEQRYERYLKLYNEATDPKMKEFYKSLYVAMATDRNQLADFASLNPQQKAELYNRVSLEVNIEIRFNVALMNSGDTAPWSVEDLQSLERSLSRLPVRDTIESDLFFIYKQKDVVTNRGRNTFGEIDPTGQSILLNDDASGDPLDPARPNFVGSAVTHLMGLRKAPTGEEMDRFMALSGWTRVANEDDPALAGLNQGDWVSAKDLKAKLKDRPEFERWKDVPDDQFFRLSKSDKGVFIHPSPPPPGIAPAFVSPLGATSPDRDFAETFNMYYNNREKLRMEHPDKHAYMMAMFGPEGG
jgi:hypothetical protein